MSKRDFPLAKLLIALPSPKISWLSSSRALRFYGFPSAWTGHGGPFNRGMPTELCRKFHRWYCLCRKLCIVSIRGIYKLRRFFQCFFCKTLVIITSRNQNALNQSTYLLSGPCFLPPVSDDFIFFPTCAKKRITRVEKALYLFRVSSVQKSVGKLLCWWKKSQTTSWDVKKKTIIMV